MNRSALSNNKIHRTKQNEQNEDKQHEKKTGYWVGNDQTSFIDRHITHSIFSPRRWVIFNMMCVIFFAVSVSLFPAPSKPSWIQSNNALSLFEMCEECAGLAASGYR